MPQLTLLRCILIFGILALILPLRAAAQEIGTCETGEASADLDVNQVRARMYNTGTLFWRGEGAFYSVPKESNVEAIFLATLQMGGLVNGEYRLINSDYGPFQLWPGPLDEQGRPPDDCSEYDRMYSIYRDSLEYFERTREATRDLLEWPAHLGAPVVDGDGVPENYSLQGGDRPALIGDQMIWWVMNDAGISKGDIRTPPLPMEVQMTAFSFNRAQALRNHPMFEHLNGVLRFATFYRYRLRYLGTDPLKDAWFSIYTDLRIGEGDDYVGSDSALGLGFVYNADEFDESVESLPGYGTPPPALGFDFFRGPVLMPDSLDNDGDGIVDEIGERGGATRFLIHGHDNSVNGWPRTPEEAHDLLRGIWRDDTPVTYGGRGYGGSSRAHFMYSGNPPAFWGEETLSENGPSNHPGYRHFNISTGPFRMEPGETEDIYLGIVWARGRDRLDSVYRLKSDDALVQSVFEELIRPDLPDEPPPSNYTLVHHYPSPVRDRATLTFALPQQEHVRLAIYDLLGREVTRLVDGVRAAGRHHVEFEVGALPSGVYFYELQAGTVRGGRTIVVAH